MSKGSSKFYQRSLTLLANILGYIDQQHFTQAQLAFELGTSKPHIYYYVRKAIRIGYIKELFCDKIRVLKLTQEGKTFLDQYNKQYNKQSFSGNNNHSLPICRAENIRFKARVYKLPIKPPDWNKIDMNNWSQYNSIVDDIKVHLNNGKAPSIEFIPSPISGSNPWELLGILFNECNEVARKLEQTLDMEIGRLEIERGAEWVVYDPIASIISRQNGQITVDGLGKINASKPLRRGELEYSDPRFAAEYLTMPRRISIIEKHISNIEKMLEDLVKKENETYDEKKNRNKELH